MLLSAEGLLPSSMIPWNSRLLPNLHPSRSHSSVGQVSSRPHALTAQANSVIENLTPCLIMPAPLTGTIDGCVCICTYDPVKFLGEALLGCAHTLESSFHNRSPLTITSSPRSTCQCMSQRMSENRVMKRRIASQPETKIECNL